MNAEQYQESITTIERQLSGFSTYIGSLRASQQTEVALDQVKLFFFLPGKPASSLKIFISQAWDSWEVPDKKDKRTIRPVPGLKDTFKDFVDLPTFVNFVRYLLNTCVTNESLHVKNGHEIKPAPVPNPSLEPIVAIAIQQELVEPTPYDVLLQQNKELTQNNEQLATNQSASIRTLLETTQALRTAEAENVSLREAFDVLEKERDGLQQRLNTTENPDITSHPVYKKLHKELMRAQTDLESAQKKVKESGKKPVNEQWWTELNLNPIQEEIFKMLFVDKKTMQEAADKLGFDTIWALWAEILRAILIQTESSKKARSR